MRMRCTSRCESRAERRSPPARSISRTSASAAAAMSGSCGSTFCFKDVQNEMRRRRGSSVLQVEVGRRGYEVGNGKLD
eukprot:scaffold119489_cov28-Tisochrysis_lutea.AAC.8